MAPATLAPTALLPLLDAVDADLPRLSRQLYENIGAALGLPRHLALREVWLRRRSRFIAAFEAGLTPRLAQARRGQDPLLAAARSLDQLSLVDEHQALKEVAVRHAAQVCQEAAPAELFQLSNFFSALQLTQAGRERNWLRPALFAQALAEALLGADLSAEAHYALVRAVSPALAGALLPLYRQLAESLRGLAVHARQSERREADAARHERSRLTETAPSEAMRPGLREQGLLRRLYPRLLADPHLPGGVRDQLARLQLALERLAVVDPQVLEDAAHPAWRLVNAIAAYGSSFDDPYDARLREFLAFLGEQTQALIDAPAPTRAPFEGLRRLVDGFIQRQSRAQQHAPSAAEREALARERQRSGWRQAVHDQLEADLQHAPLTRRLREFLLGAWVDVIVATMVQEGEGSAAVQRLLDLVDTLVDSLRSRPDSGAREALRQRLPGLVDQLEAGMARIALAPAQRQLLLGELAQQHARVLGGRDAGVSTRGGPDSGGDSRLSSQRDAAASLQHLLAEREGGTPSVWAQADIDRTLLPTQPQSLPGALPALPGAAPPWAETLTLGDWLHLSLHGHWRTLQLAWISEDGQFFLFVGQQAHERHTLTRGALMALYRAGLAINLDQHGVVERALLALQQEDAGSH